MGCSTFLLGSWKPLDRSHTASQGNLLHSFNTPMQRGFPYIQPEPSSFQFMNTASCSLPIQREHEAVLINTPPLSPRCSSFTSVGLCTVFTVTKSLWMAAPSPCRTTISPQFGVICKHKSTLCHYSGQTPAAPLLLPICVSVWHTKHFCLSPSIQPVFFISPSSPAICTVQIWIQEYCWRQSWKF